MSKVVCRCHKPFDRFFHRNQLKLLSPTVVIKLILFTRLFASRVENLERRISKLSSLKTDVQAFQRFYLSGGQVVDVDAQGRVSIPQSLRKFAGLESQIVLVGLGAKFEIWSQASWQSIYEQLTENFEETLNAVASLDEPKGGD